MGRSINSFTNWVGDTSMEGERVALPEKDLWVSVLSRAALDVVLNPNRLQEQQTNQVLFSMLAPILGQILGPQALRPMAQDLWEGHGKKNFDSIWPSEGVPQFQSEQPPQPGMGQPAQEGSPVGPPPGQPPLDTSNLTAFLGGMGPQAPPAAPEEGPELEPDEEGATLQ